MFHHSDNASGKRSWLFFTAYAILIISSFISSVAVGFTAINIAYLVVVAIAFLRLLYIQVSRIAILAALISIPAVLVCFLFAREPLLVVIAVLVFSAKGINFDDIVKVSFRLVMALLALTIPMVLLGLLPDEILVRELHGRLVECHSLGFYHYSKVPTFWFYLYLGYAYLNRGRYSFAKHLLWVIGGLVIYLVCYERLRFYLLLIAFFLFAAVHFTRKQAIGQKLRIVCTTIYPVFFGAAFLLAHLYSPSDEIMSVLNSLLSGRLRLESAALDNFGITLFGQSVEMNNEIGLADPLQYMFVDAAFIFVPIVYGAIIGSLLLLCCTYLMHKAASDNNLPLVLMLLCIAIDCLVGNQLLSIWLCPILFYLACSPSPQLSVSPKVAISSHGEDSTSGAQSATAERQAGPLSL
jgi:hypothetical protein